MPVIRAGEVPTWEVQGNRMTGMAAPSRGASEVMAWKAELDAGVSSPPHTHDHEEVVVLVSGAMKVRIGEEEYELSEGDAFIVPPGTLHQVRNEADTAAACITAMPVGTRFVRPDGQETPPPPWTR